MPLELKKKYSYRCSMNIKYVVYKYLFQELEKNMLFMLCLISFSLFLYF